MKHIKEILLIGLIVFGGIFIKASGAIGQKDYEDELKDRKVKVEEYLGQVDGAKKEFIEKIISHEYEDPSLIISETINLDTDKSYKRIKAMDSKKDIEIDGRLDGIVFFRKGGERYWINNKSKTYYKDNYDYRKNPKENPIILRNENMIYEYFLMGYEKKVEKIKDTYKVTSLDDLNKGSYTLYDSKAVPFESFSDNSEGRFKTVQVLKSKDVNESYKELVELKDSYTQVESRSQIEN